VLPRLRVGLSASVRRSVGFRASVLPRLRVGLSASVCQFVGLRASMLPRLSVGLSASVCQFVGLRAFVLPRLRVGLSASVLQQQHRTSGTRADVRHRIFFINKKTEVNWQRKKRRKTRKNKIKSWTKKNRNGGRSICAWRGGERSEPPTNV